MANPRIPAERRSLPQDAMRDLVDRDWLKSHQHSKQLHAPEFGGVHPDIVDFARLFIGKAAKAGIPLHIDRFDDNYAVQIVHGRWGYNLTPQQWVLLGHIGMQVASSRSLKIRWGDAWRPSQWAMADETLKGKTWPTITKAERQWSRPLPSKRKPSPNGA